MCMCNKLLYTRKMLRILLTQQMWDSFRIIIIFNVLNNGQNFKIGFNLVYVFAVFEKFYQVKDKFEENLQNGIENYGRTGYETMANIDRLQKQVGLVIFFNDYC